MSPHALEARRRWMRPVPAEIDVAQAVDRRRAVEGSIAAARAQEQALRDDRAALLLDEVSTINGERLGLLPHLSAERRAAITSFSAAGLEQARSEARHLQLILRYHRYIALSWLSSLRAAPLGAAPMWRVGSVAVPWLLAVMMIQSCFAIQITARPYVFDCKYEEPFTADVHFRVIEALHERGIGPPAILQRILNVPATPESARRA